MGNLSPTKHTSPIKRYISRIQTLSLVLLSLCLCACLPLNKTPLDQQEQNWLQEQSGKLDILFGYEAAPNAYFNEDGEYVGLLVDFYKEFENKLDFQFKLQELPTWNDLIEYSKNHQDFVIVGIAYTQKRSEYLRFTEPFISSPYVIVTRSDNYRSSMKSLAGQEVCTVAGYSVNDYLAKKHPQITRRGVKNDLAGLQAVSTGQCDAMITNQMYATYLISEKGISNLRIGGETGYEIELSAAVSIHNPKLFSILEKTVNSFDDSTRQKLYDKWINWGQPSIVSFIGPIIAGVLSLIAGLIFLSWAWTRSLQTQVLQKTKELSDSEKKFRSLVENSPDIIYQTDLKGQITFISPSIEKISGFTVEDLFTGNLSETIYSNPQDRDDLWLSLYEHGGVKDFELKLNHKSGHHWWGLINAHFLKGGDGQLLGVQGIIRDISSRKLKEKALRESEERFRTIFNQQFQFMAVLSRSGRVEEINELVLQKQGVKREDYIGKLFWNTPAWRDLPEWKSIWVHRLKQAAQQKTPIVTEDIYQTSDGSIRFADAATTAMYQSDGKLAGFIVQANDTTERKQTEQALHLNAERLRLATEQAGVAVWEYDLERNLMERSRNHDPLYGLPHQAIWDMDTFMNTVHSEDRKRVYRALQKAAAPGGSEQFTFDFRVIWPDQSIHWLAITGEIAKRNATGKATLTRGCLIDITERKDAESELVKLAQAVEQSPESIVITNTRAEIEYVNEAFISNTGYKLSEVKGKKPSLLKSGSTPPERYKDMWTCLSTGQPWQGELYNRRKDGSTFIDYAIISPIRQNDGTISHYVSVQEDVGEKKTPC